MNRLLKRWQRPGLWLAIVAVNTGLLALTVGKDYEPQQAEPEPPERIVQIEGSTQGELRFEALDVFVDVGEKSLAAYQLEIEATTDGVEIAGIEGGEHAAFRKPPYYDPKAMAGNRIILAAFDTGDDLPAGRIRVARIHLQLQGAGAKKYRTRLSVAADADGKPVPAKLQIERNKA